MKTLIHIWIYPVCITCTAIKHRRDLIVVELFSMWHIPNGLPNLIHIMLLVCDKIHISCEFILFFFNYGFPHINHVGWTFTSSYTPPKSKKCTFQSWIFSVWILSQMFITRFMEMHKRMDLLPDTYNCGLCMRRECRERLPPTPRVSDPDMHHDTCVTHVPWCMPGSLLSGFIWNRWRGKRFRHSRRMRDT